MTTDPMTPISGKLAGDLLAMLGQFRADSSTHPTLRSRIDALCTELGEAIYGEHRHHFELMCAELLEAVGRATGRRLSTVATVASVKAAVDALEHTAPVLATNVVELRAPTRDTQAHIEAAASRAVADAPAPISGLLIIDGVLVADPVDLWQAPTRGQLLRVPGPDERERAVVRGVCWLGARLVEIHAERTWPASARPALREVGP